MQLVNATKMQAGYTLGVQPDGRELLVAVVKGTFTIPKNGGEPELAKEQVPLVLADEFTGEPGFSAPRYELDFAPRKPKCDVLLNGRAYAPFGKAQARVTVSLRVGTWSKSFDVVGNRVWRPGVFHLGMSEPEPFVVMPISYNNAFGGVDSSLKDEHRYYLSNHAGVGYSAHKDPKLIDGKPLPNTEETGKPIKQANGSYRPMAFGPIGRAWQQRVKLAGTYDQKWIDETFPFLPADFKDEYYQAASADQQIDHLQGGEEVELINLTNSGRVHFKLPRIGTPFRIFYQNGDATTVAGALDTLLFEPDLERFTMHWRCCVPLRKNIFEIKFVVPGDPPRRWFQKAGVLPGVHRFESLAEWVAWRNQRRQGQS